MVSYVNWTFCAVAEQVLTLNSVQQIIIIFSPLANLHFGGLGGRCRRHPNMGRAFSARCKCLFIQYQIFYLHLLFYIISFGIKLFEIKYSTGICILNLEYFIIMANNTSKTTYLCKNTFFYIKFIAIIFFFLLQYQSYLIVYNTKIFTTKFT